MHFSISIDTLILTPVTTLMYFSVVLLFDIAFACNSYQLDRWNDAASASYTFYLANPNDENMRNNIAFYRDVLKVVASDFIDLEMRPYKVIVINKQKACFLCFICLRNLCDFMYCFL